MLGLDAPKYLGTSSWWKADEEEGNHYQRVLAQDVQKTSGKLLEARSTAAAAVL